jgi:DNA-binding transcriptional LysR family regulator
VTDSSAAAAVLRIAFVPGVTPGRWLRTWERRYPAQPLEARQVEESEQRRVLDEGSADMCFVRLPVERDGLHLIPLYDELPVAVVGAEHPAAAYDELALAEFADDLRIDDPALSARQRIGTVAAGTGYTVLPMSVARLHHRRDVRHVRLNDLPPTTVGLAWPVDGGGPLVETFIGIVRGRTERSSRGDVIPGAAPATPPKPGHSRRPARASRAQSRRRGRRRA